MTSTIDRNGLEVIPRAECISLLELVSVRRLRGGVVHPPTRSPTP